MRGLRYLLDTNLCIYIARRRPPEVQARFAALEPGEVGMSVITFGELRHGAAKSQRPEEAGRTIEALVRLIPALPLDAAAGECYGAVRAALERAGTPIGGNDLWIAAHALALGVTLVSNNTRELERVPGLVLENWIR